MWTSSSDLLADLALHRLDVVLADRAAPPNPNLKLYSHSLGSSALAWYAPPALAPRRARTSRNRWRACRCCCRPRTRRCAALDQWFERDGMRAAHRRRIRGQRPAQDLRRQRHGRVPGRRPACTTTWWRATAWSASGPCDGVEEHFFAIGTEKKVLHPLVQRLLPPRSA